MSSGRAYPILMTWLHKCSFGVSPAYSLQRAPRLSDIRQVAWIRIRTTSRTLVYNALSVQVSVFVDFSKGWVLWIATQRWLHANSGLALRCVMVKFKRSCFLKLYLTSCFRPRATTKPVPTSNGIVLVNAEPVQKNNPFSRTCSVGCCQPRRQHCTLTVQIARPFVCV